jgi:16S rRNA (guanine527-N7)-methyltransferase
LPAGAADQLAALLGALEREADPPTTVRQGQAALDVHVADSLAALELAELTTARRIADLGSGAGFPGLVLAVALPGSQVDLIDSRSRKTAVSDRLLQAALLSNARSITTRAEDWARHPAPVGGREAYDAVTARALAPLAALAEYASPLLEGGGVLAAWKGARDRNEERGLESAARGLAMELERVQPVQPFPGSRNRHLYLLRKAGPTPDGLPRRAGMARKRPFSGSAPNQGGSDRARD